MQKAITLLIKILVLVSTLSGCNFSDTFWFSPEDKINAAFPVSKAVSNYKEAVFAIIPASQRKDIEAQFNARLKLRALNCAKDYSPSWYTSMEEVKKTLEGQSCFSEFDNEISKWLGLRRVGLILTKPTLKPIPANPPSFIVADEIIQAARFPANAGLALLETQQAIEVVDFETMNPIFREARGSTTIGSPSPNGRLFTTSDGDRLRIREVDSGNNIIEIPSVRARDFHWLDDRTALYKRSDSGKAFLVDFSNGKELSVKMLIGDVQRAIRAPGTEDHYILFSSRGVTKIEFLRDKLDPELKLLAEKPIKNINWNLNTSETTADGARYFNANHNLTLISLESLEIESIKLEPFNLQTGSPTSDPDKIIFTGYVNNQKGSDQRDFIYSTVNHTLTPIDRAKVSSNRYLYISSLQKQAVITGNKIEILDELPTMETFSLSKFIVDMQDVVNQHKAEVLERLQAQQDYNGNSKQVIYTHAKSGTTVAMVPNIPKPQGDFVAIENWKVTLVTAKDVPKLGEVRGITDSFTFEGRIFAHITLTAPLGSNGGRPLFEVKWFSGDTMSSIQKANYTVTNTPYFLSSSVSGTVLGAGKRRVEVFANGKLLASKEFRVSGPVEMPSP